VDYDVVGPKPISAAGPFETDCLRAPTGVVGDGDRPGPATRRSGFERHFNTAIGPRVNRAGAVVGLGEVAAVGSGEHDARDGQGRRPGVAELHRLLCAGGADLLRPKRERRRREAGRGSSACACQTDGLRAAAGIVGDSQSPAPRPARTGRKRHIDSAVGSRAN